MADKWTPGPWRISPEKTRDGDVIVMSPDWEIAWVRADAGDVPEGDQSETEANAHLITAAPELYSALEALDVAVVRKGCNDPEESGEKEDAALYLAVMDALAAARAALAKARGETPASEAPGTPVSVEQAR